MVHLQSVYKQTWTIREPISRICSWLWYSPWFLQEFPYGKGSIGPQGGHGTIKVLKMLYRYRWISWSVLFLFVLFCVFFSFSPFLFFSLFSSSFPFPSLPISPLLSLLSSLPFPSLPFPSLLFSSLLFSSYLREMNVLKIYSLLTDALNRDTCFWRLKYPYM